MLPPTTHPPTHTHTHPWKPLTQHAHNNFLGASDPSRPSSITYSQTTSNSPFGCSIPQVLSSPLLSHTVPIPVFSSYMSQGPFLSSALPHSPNTCFFLLYVHRSSPPLCSPTQSQYLCFPLICPRVLSSPLLSHTVPIPVFSSYMSTGPFLPSALPHSPNTCFFLLYVHRFFPLLYSPIQSQYLFFPLICPRVLSSPLLSHTVPIPVFSSYMSTGSFLSALPHSPNTCVFLLYVHKSFPLLCSPTQSQYLFFPLICPQVLSSLLSHTVPIPVFSSYMSTGPFLSSALPHSPNTCVFLLYVPGSFPPLCSPTQSQYLCFPLICPRVLSSPLLSHTVPIPVFSSYMSTGSFLSSALLHSPNTCFFLSHVTYS
ncbi:uncharacterized protein LOC126984630 isoform X3 [Eriocheir sinensis]|uniref:uncharacterized protein LOC126984630 isoform X2 n=1 Tax=Eriocheir sinensis TaxID=95602 RepID=UPI0021C6FA26|nr:uncharacterized protein LOC126984630 isoform X2 [Eriocheir sinensis]XP_050694428.1 uncharacterized protein LOC126984630 isoform X3 [Eriocheir sinensis]